MNPALTAVTNGTVNGDVINVTLATTAAQLSSVGVSNLTVTLGSNPNYTVLTTNSTLTINPKAAAVTASNASKIYGQTKTFAGTEFTIAGLINGDSVTSVTLTSSGTTNTAAVGGYPIVASAASGSGLGNYTLSYVNGTLAVNAATPVSLNPPVYQSGVGVQLSFTGGDNGLSYRLQFCPSLGSPVWSTLVTNVPVSGGMSSFNYLDSDATNAAARFYRTVTP